MDSSVFFINDLLVFFDNGLDGLIRDIKEFDESFSAPESFFIFAVDDDSVASADVIAIIGLIRVDLIFLGFSGC